MVDPLSEIVALLQPTARFSKLFEGAGRWRVRRESVGEPFYGAVLEGECRLSIDGAAPLALQTGDFVLVPAMHELVNASVEADASTATALPVQLGDGHFRAGRLEAPVELRMQIGHCQFGSPDAALLVALLALAAAAGFGWKHWKAVQAGQRRDAEEMRQRWQDLDQRFASLRRDQRAANERLQDAAAT
ncbi:AraC family transcriptional regulator, partial [Xanthomonas sp. Kuri4-3]